MRLIDADLIVKEYSLDEATKYGNKDAKQQMHSYDTMMMYEIADMIDDAPTIDPFIDVISKIFALLEDNNNEDECYAYEDVLQILAQERKKYVKADL